MKKGLLVFVSILRILAVLCGVIYLLKGNNMFFSICLICASLLLIIETINSIAFHRQIRWLFIVPLSSIIPGIIIGIIVLFVCNGLGKDNVQLIAMTIPAVALCSWWFLADIVHYRKAKRIVEERHRYDDYGY